MNKNNIKKITFTGIMLELGYFTLIPLYNKLSHKETQAYNIRGGYRL